MDGAAVEPAPAPPPTEPAPPPGPQAPPLAPPRKRSLGPVVAVVVVVAVLAAAFAYLVLIPVAQSVPESFSISDPGSTTLRYVYNITFYHAGSFSFIWNSNNSGVLNFTITDPSAEKVYAVTSSDGLGDISILSGGTYSFSILHATAESVTVSGTFDFRAPYL
jgi:hypothetical protein